NSHARARAARHGRGVQRVAARKAQPCPGQQPKPRHPSLLGLLQSAEQGQQRDSHWPQTVSLGALALAADVKEEWLKKQ
ncbi:Adrenocortical Dysplasia Protein-like, partial [Manis pentadactyla]